MLPGVTPTKKKVSGKHSVALINRLVGLERNTTGVKVHDLHVTDNNLIPGNSESTKQHPGDSSSDQSTLLVHKVTALQDALSSRGRGQECPELHKTPPQFFSVSLSMIPSDLHTIHPTFYCCPMSILKNIFFFATYGNYTVLPLGGRTRS